MLKNARLATRIGLGFLSIVAISALLGIFCVTSMSRVESVASDLAGEHIPAVSIASDIERWSYLTMYATRGYVFAGDGSLKGTAEENLAKVMASIDAGLAHASAHDNRALADRIQVARDQATVYANRFHETVQEIETMAGDRKDFEASMNRFLQACEGLLALQYDGSESGKEGDAAGGSEKAAPVPDIGADHVEKVRIAESLLAVGNEIRLDAWRAIALNDPAIMRATQANYKEADTLLQALSPRGTGTDERDLIEECRAAREDCGMTMDSFLMRWQSRLEKDEERAVAAQGVLDTARDAAKLNMETMDRYANSAAEQLSQTSKTLALGLFVGAVVALLLAGAITSGITGPLEQLTRAAGLAAEGDLREVPEIHTGGELGALSATFRRMNLFFREMGEKGDALARGDYTIEIRPRSENDALGKSFAEVTRTLRAVAEVSQGGASGDYSAQVEVKGERDELGRAINEMIRRLRAVAEESKSREWFKTGVAELAEHMRGEHSVKSLAEAVVTFLSDHLDAPMATLYVPDPARQSLHLKASCAADLDRVPVTINIGDGVAGQAAAGRRARTITDLPSEYPFISSSLGATPPGSVLAYPILHSGEVTVVLELAFIGTPEDRVLAFLRTVEEGIAIAFAAAVSRQRMQELLEVLQAQTEELQAQTEELESQQLALKTSNEELEQQSEELRSSNEELEEKTQALERQAAQLEERRQEVERGKHEIEEKASELELANRYKSEFLANMSHELRTPLNSLLILAKMLAGNDEGNLNDEQVASARIIYEGGQDLLLLINEILDLSKVEAGMMEIRPEPIGLEGLLARTQSLFQPTASEKGLDFSVTRLGGTPDSLFTDGQRLEQILRNLLSNAFKFTAAGSVRLEVHKPGREAELAYGGPWRDGGIAFSIHDAGPGIPEDKREAIFEAFRQADGSTSRHYGGTGLGLSISRALAHLLGGEIGLETSVGQGSTFTLYLPISVNVPPGGGTRGYPVPPPAPIPAEPVVSAPGGQESAPQPFVPDDRELIEPGDRTVLIIEDDRTFAGILLEQAHKKGFKCLTAGDGSGGIRLANQFKPSAIILDLGLPDIDGGTVLDSLKYNLATRHIPVHVVSARDKSREMLNKGALGYLSKPVDLMAIDQALERIEELLVSTAKRILVVEDDGHSRSAIEKLLAAEGVEIIGSGTGADAIERVNTGNFDCIILDLGLPDMSGFDVLRSLASNPAIALPPTIVYTGRELTREEVRELGKYTTNVVVKGVNSPERLLDETSLFLHTVASKLPRVQRQMLRMLHDPEHLLKGRKVLLVDDDLRNSFALSRVLEKASLNVFLAENGEVALDTLDREPDIELVLMDIMMPVMDGYEAIARIRAQSRFKELPIVALTAKAMQDDRAKCIEAGANDYLAKPLDTDKLLSLMRLLLYK
ncbi:MAG: response regulator [Candidatus Hydrogenedentes bacterium]|nr:response regulator [Candidatus Hydrogenedentota bacterium]